MVFQNYALYPHMTVRDNMSFALMLAKRTKADDRRSASRGPPRSSASTPYLDRYPRQLSGGQRQRVAMGRAIVRDPQVFLFDEPLSNLDAKLRVQMRTEIKELHQRLKTTSIYVTHDQIEAMTMADQIVVMRDGLVEQTGAPLELYDHPANMFVAGFIGSPAMNFLPGTARANGARRGVEFDDGVRAAAAARRAPARRPAGALRHAARASARSADDGGMPAEVVVVEPTGADTQLFCRFNGAGAHRGVPRPRHDFAPGDTIGLHARPRARASVRRRERRAARGLSAIGTIATSIPHHTKEETVMSEFKRRKFLKTSAGVAAARRCGAGPLLWRRDAHAQTVDVQAGEGREAARAALEPLRAGRRSTSTWRTSRSSPTSTGIEVRVDNEGWEDVRPKAAVAANTGAGPDIILSTNDDAQPVSGQAAST